MKLAPRLTFALVLGVLGVHIGAATYRVIREHAAFVEDMGRDARVLGRALAFAAERAWPSGGEREVLALAAHTTDRKEHAWVRWLRLGGSAPQVHPRPLEAAAAELTMLEGAPRTLVHQGGEELLLTYVPVVVSGETQGVLEIAEPLADQRAYIRESIAAAALTAFILALLCGAVAWWVSSRVVARPIERLIARARGVGAGDLKHRVPLVGSEEIQLLASEMNRMCDALQNASESAQSEATARALAVEQLRHADRLATVGSMASSLAHELGTPINVIDGHAQLIREHGLGESVERHVALIDSQCRRMTRLIRQWLDFARRGRTQDERCDLGPVLRRCVHMLRPMAEASKVTLELKGSGAGRSVALAESALTQVVVNLALNAIQAMPTGGPLELAMSDDRCSGAAGRSFLKMEVRDTGVGIPREILDRIFEPFFTTKPPGAGTGLGLPIAGGILQECGGWFEVAACPSGGTCFTVYLPEA